MRELFAKKRASQRARLRPELVQEQHRRQCFDWRNHRDRCGRYDRWRSHSGRVSTRVVVVFHLAVAQGHRVYRAAVAPADCAIGFAVASGRDGNFFERWLVAVPMRRNFVHKHPQPPISNELWHSCSAHPFRSDLTFAFAISFSLKRPISLGLKR